MANEDYIDVKFDIFEYVGQRARVRRSLIVSTLKDEILKEFDDIPADDPDNYAIYLKGAEEPLDEKQTLSELDVQPQDELIFDHFRNFIRRMLPPEEYVYLVEGRTNRPFEIQWQPAVIGRPSTDIDHNIVLAVNLQTIPEGNWISRRHAQVTVSNGRYYIEPLAEYNPVILNGKQIPFGKKAELNNGDILLMGPKKLSMTFQMRTTRPKTDSKTDPMSKQFVQSQPEPQPSAISSPTSFGNLEVPTLVVLAATDEGNLGKTILLGELPLVLGRTHPLLMTEKQVSRQHAQISQDEKSKKIYVIDLESTNGVIVNGMRIAQNTPVEVVNGSQIGLGNKLLLRLNT